MSFAVSMPQFEPVVARQGLVCYDPESFFQDHNKPTKTSLRPSRLCGSIFLIFSIFNIQ